MVSKSSASKKSTSPIGDLAEPAHILIVEARFYADIADAMAAGAMRALKAAGATVERAPVPGAFELPAALRMAIEGGRYHGYVALGCVIRGDTSHYDIVCNETSRGLGEIAAREGIALGFGLLTCDTEDQAWERADPKRQDKGGDAARACLTMIALKLKLAGAQPP
ncbi:MAG: 6,7-dimethyl-8-ribityllumazine synthase [Alphaproteobacteria bacterium]|nr:6,7-dimethyl-8-ribityllumazine synthase [Alphaproteobacteria bacterium]